MMLRDAIFGEVEINEPVLIDLINSKPLQRVKKINQGGPCQYIHAGLAENNRFVHCVGAMLLLRHFKATLAEQIAGLLHDVSHTAFSHLADYVFGGNVYEMDYQDSILDQFISRSEIPEILSKHGIKVEEVLDLHRFPLQEQPIPDLCADRIDYSLRHPFFAYHIAPLRTDDVLKHLIVHDGKFMMDNAIVAWKYARAFLSWYHEDLAGPRCLAAHEILADAIKRAIAIGVMSKEDMFKDDEYVMDKLCQSRDPHIEQLIAQLNLEFDCVIDTANPDLVSGIKTRYIDPLVIEEGKVQRVSEIYSDFAKELEMQKEKFHHKKFPIRIINKAKEVEHTSVTT